MQGKGWIVLDIKEQATEQNTASGEKEPEASGAKSPAPPLGLRRVRAKGETILTEDASPFARLRERFTRSSALGFQAGRKKKGAIDQKPDFGLLEIFYRYKEETCSCSDRNHGIQIIWPATRVSEHS